MQAQYSDSQTMKNFALSLQRGTFEMAQSFIREEKSAVYQVRLQ